MMLSVVHSWLRPCRGLSGRLWCVSLTLFISAGVVACQRPRAKTETTKLIIGTAPPDGTLGPVGVELAAIYSRHIPGVEVTVQFSKMSTLNLSAVERGEVQIAMVGVDAIYAAYTKGTPQLAAPHQQLRAIGVLFTAPIYVLVPHASNITDVRHVKGLRVGVGAIGSNTEATTRIVLEAHGLGYNDVKTYFYKTVSEALNKLLSGDIDAAIVPYITRESSRPIQEHRIRIVNLSEAAISAILSRYPYFKLYTVTEADGSIQTVAVDVAIICRKDLPNDLVYDLTRLVFSELPAAVEHIGLPTSINIDKAPAVPIPLHPGAAKFYREYELRR